MSLFVDGAEPSKIFSGEAEVASVFVGEDKVWPTAVADFFELTQLGVTGLSGPGGVIIEADTGVSRVWVSCQGTGTVEVFDLVSGVSQATFTCLTKSVTPTATIPTALNSYYMVSHGGQVFAADYDGGRIHCLNTADLSYGFAMEFPTRPRGMAARGDYLYVSDGADPLGEGVLQANLHAVKISTASADCAPEFSVPVGPAGSAYGDGYVALTQDGKRLYHTCSEFIQEVDLEAATVTAEFFEPRVPGAPLPGQAAIISSGGVERLFVAGGGMNQSGAPRVDIYDTATNLNIGTITGFDGAATALVASPDGRKVYVTTYVGKLTYQLDGSSGEILGSAGSSQVRFQLAVSPDGRHIATASLAGEGAGTVEVFEAGYSGQGTPAP